MQFVGTELFRTKMKLLHPDFKDLFWIMCTKNKIKNIWECNPKTLISISDVRFDNEAYVITELGGKNIRVINPRINNETDNHTSETEMKKIKVDGTIINDGTKEELYDKIETLLFNI